MLSVSDFPGVKKSEKIYVASSWRNNFQTAIVQICRSAGFEVYDFKNPAKGDNGFRWSDIHDGWPRGEADGMMSTEDYVEAVNHPVAVEGFRKDFEAMEWADTVIYVLPCGKSASLELGWGVGKGLKTCVYLGENPMRPELMYRMADFITDSTMDLLAWLGVED